MSNSRRFGVLRFRKKGRESALFLSSLPNELLQVSQNKCYSCQYCLQNSFFFFFLLVVIIIGTLEDFKGSL